MRHLAAHISQKVADALLRDAKFMGKSPANFGLYVIRGAKFQSTLLYQADAGPGEEISAVTIYDNAAIKENPVGMGKIVTGRPSKRERIYPKKFSTSAAHGGTLTGSNR
jgi:hypothetical protein